MNNLKKAIIVFVMLLPLFCFAANSEQITKDRMKSDLDIIRNSLQVVYAPAEWKFAHAGWSLDEKIEEAKQKIQNTSPISTKAYQRIVKDFFNSMCDYHVKVRFHSTESATLPFLVTEAEGKFYITYINTKKLPFSAYSFSEGDELVTFDGRPTAEVIQELREMEQRSGNDTTDRAIATYMLTNRRGIEGHVVPKGPITIGVRSETDKINYYQLIWLYTPEKITNHFKGAIPASPKDLTANKQEDLSELQQLLLNNQLLKKSMTAPQFEFFKVIAKNCEGSKQDVGGKESFIPVLGKIWWESDKDSFYKAYLYETEDRKLIGYIRIPHFIGFDEEIKEFEKVIGLFQERSDAMVIDQVNNPGGFLEMCYGLSSMLTDKPLDTPKHRITISQADIAMAVEVLEILEKHIDILDFDSTFFGMPVTNQTIQFYIDYLNFIINEWNEGRTLTQPTYLNLVDKVNPHPSTRYTKPILLLTNHLDFSGGDFFPAILQDNKRVTILGTRTAGAGGYVRNMSFPNLFGIDNFNYTASIAERVDKNPIEDLGVSPDIHYAITAEDIKFGYQNYKQAINKAVLSLIKTSKGKGSKLPNPAPAPTPDPKPMPEPESQPESEPQKEPESLPMPEPV